MANQRQQQNANAGRQDRQPQQPTDQERQRDQQERQRREEVAEARRTYLSRQYGYTPEQIDVVRNFLCLKATDEEIEFFLATCKRVSLDPFSKQIYFIKRNQKRQDAHGNDEWIEVGRPETSIDGLRAIAEMSGEYEGQAPMQWCGKEGKWTDVWLDPKNAPIAAKATVFRRGHQQPMVAVALFDEYAPRNKTAIVRMWQEKPCGQIAKCAEALAFRRAFPRDMSGLYTDDEMARSAAESAGYVAPIAGAQPVIDVKETKQLDEKRGVTLDELLKPLTGEDADTIAKMRDTISKATSRDEVSPVGRELKIIKDKNEQTPFAKAALAIVGPELQKKWASLPPSGARPPEAKTSDEKKTQTEPAKP
jgi:phage recombination protein Bet